MNKPSTIFKYQSANLINISNFRNHALYMASPALFNDPYDCDIRFNLEDLNEDQINYFRENMHNFSNESRFLLEINKLGNESLKLLLENNTIETLNNFKSKFLKNYGVSCFTEVKDDILMWGHYADSFKGFCLEFRTEFAPFLEFHQVIYKNCFPTFNILDIYLHNLEKVVKDLYCIKYENWEYEKEWRVLHKVAGTLFHYEPQCLKAIYFGPKMDTSIREIFCLILNGQNPDVELWQGKLSNDNFGIEFDRFYYTSYIDGKKMGLII